ncbi:hypothetical protein SESBI_26466 [Sesbania bispinosa]|nr:hypothetical protein SESBI_26466 [Sesbania bispinosa]
MVEASQLRSRIAEIQRICNDDDSNSSDGNDNLLNDCALHVQNRVQQIVSEFSDPTLLGIEDIDAYLEHVKEELNKVEVETTNLANEIELLATTHKDVYSFAHSYGVLDQKTAEATEGIDSPMLVDDCSNLTVVNLEENLEQLELENKIDEMKSVLKSLEDLQSKVIWFDAVEQIEDALMG